MWRDGPEAGQTYRPTYGGATPEISEGGAVCVPADRAAETSIPLREGIKRAYSACGT